jgi:hypothetical protein
MEAEAEQGEVLNKAKVVTEAREVHHRCRAGHDPRPVRLADPSTDPRRQVEIVGIDD